MTVILLNQSAGVCQSPGAPRTRPKPHGREPQCRVPCSIAHRRARRATCLAGVTLEQDPRMPTRPVLGAHSAWGSCHSAWGPSPPSRRYCYRSRSLAAPMAAGSHLAGSTRPPRRAALPLRAVVVVSFGFRRRSLRRSLSAAQLGVNGLLAPASHLDSSSGSAATCHSSAGVQPSAQL